MALSKQDEIRNRREREFQTRLLAAAEKPAAPDRSSVWKALNSPIVIWLLSAALITTVGSYITTQQQCLREADRLIEQYDKLLTEMKLRTDHVALSVTSAKTPNDLQSQLANVPTGYSDLKAKSIIDLSSELQRIIRRVSNRQELPREIDAGSYRVDFYQLHPLLTERDLTPESFGKLRDDFKLKANAYGSFNRPFLHGLVSSCGFTSTFGLIYDPNAPVLRSWYR
jgi:hypothetical protein